MKNATIQNFKSKYYLSAIFTIVFITVAYAANYQTTGSGGSWNNGGTWNGSGVPPAAGWGGNTISINQNVTVPSGSINNLTGYTSVSLSGNKSLTIGTSSTANNFTFTQTIFNISNGNVTVYGNLSLDDTDIVITTGSLIVTGTLTLTNGATIINNSTGAINVGALSMVNSGSNAISINNGSLSVTNALNIDNGSVTVGAAKTLTAGSLTIGNNSGAILNNNGTTTINGNITQSSAINNSSTGVMNVNGTINMQNTGTAVFNNTGTLTVTGDLNIPGSAKFKVFPDGETFINGSVTSNGNENLIVGTNVNPPKYADMVIRQNLKLTGSGDVLIDKNGRFAVFGNVTSDTQGGSQFKINSGGQVYVDGDMAFTGGGDNIVNNNSTSPYGLYTDGTVTYKPNSGSGTTGHAQGTVTTMYNEDRPFYDWVAGIPNGPLPITLLYFKVMNVQNYGIGLQWVTTFEKNFSHFQIERASDDLNFTTLAMLESRGGLNINAVYNYTDQIPEAGKNYYRLKSVDHDGTFEYSSVVYAEWGFSRGVSVYPNPIISRSVTIELNDKMESPTHVYLLDGAGSQVFDSILTKSTSTLNLPADINRGLYYLRLSSGSEQKIIKVVVN